MDFGNPFPDEALEKAVDLILGGICGVGLGSFVADHGSGRAVQVGEIVENGSRGAGRRRLNRVGGRDGNRRDRRHRFDDGHKQIPRAAATVPDTLAIEELTDRAGAPKAVRAVAAVNSTAIIVRAARRTPHHPTPPSAGR